MANTVVETVLKSILKTGELYQRLILLVALPGSGKTATLQNIQKKIGARLLNVNLELSRQLLGLTERQRTLQVSRLLSALINEAPSDVVLIDNIELLFDPLLKQDPMRLLQGLSRHKTLVVSWPGSVINEHIVYAVPDHPEYKRYPVREIIVIRL